MPPSEKFTANGLVLRRNGGGEKGDLCIRDFRATLDAKKVNVHNAIYTYIFYDSNETLFRSLSSGSVEDLYI